MVAHRGRARCDELSAAAAKSRIGTGRTPATYLDAIARSRALAELIVVDGSELGTRR